MEEQEEAEAEIPRKNMQEGWTEEMVHGRRNEGTKTRDTRRVVKIYLCVPEKAGGTKSRNLEAKVKNEEQ